MKLKALAIALGAALGLFFGNQDKPQQPRGAPASGKHSPFKDRSSLTPKAETAQTPPETAANLSRTTRLRQLIERLATANVGDFPLIWEETIADQVAAGDRFEIQFNKSQINYLILHEWASRDAGGAWEYLQANAGDESKSSDSAITYLATAWLKLEPSAALKKLTASPWDDLDRRLRRALAEHDQQLALAHWKQTHDADAAIPLEILYARAELDPITAINELDMDSPSSMASRIIEALRVDQLDSLLPALASKGGSEKELRSDYRSIGSMLSKQEDQGASIDWLLAQPHSEVRAQIFDGFLQHLPVSPELLSRIAALPLEEQLEFGSFEDLIEAEHVDRKETWDWLGSLDPRVRETALSAGSLSDFSHAWALHDLDAAFEMLNTTSSNNSSDIVDGLALASGERHPLEGLARAAQLPPELRASFIETVGKQWSKHSPDEYLAHLDSTPPGQELDNLQRGGFGKLAQQGPEAASDLVLELFEAPEAIDNSVKQVVEAWAKQDVGAAEQWIEKLPDSHHTSAAVALGAVTEDRDPAAATRIYLSITDSTTRTEVLHDYIGELAALDPEATRELVNTTTMDDDTRQELLNALVPPPN